MYFMRCHRPRISSQTILFYNTYLHLGLNHNTPSLFQAICKHFDYWVLDNKDNSDRL